MSLRLLLILQWRTKKMARPGSRSAGRVASRAAERNSSRDASLKPCEARRDEMRLDVAGMKRRKRGEQNGEPTGRYCSM